MYYIYIAELKPLSLNYLLLIYLFLGNHVKEYYYT